MIFRYIRVLSEVENQMKYAAQKRVLFEVALIKLCRPEMETDYESLINRIHNVEGRLEHGVAVQLPQQSASSSEKNLGSVSETPEKKILESAVPDEVKSLVGNWQQVLNRLDSGSKNMLNHVTLTVSDEGALIIAFPDETTYLYFVQNENHTEQVRQAASEVIGKTLKIEYKFIADRREYDAIPELRSLFGDSDIIIETM
jgi:DNA polymerase-3 subunit gamma/tau